MKNRGVFSIALRILSSSALKKNLDFFRNALLYRQALSFHCGVADKFLCAVNYLCRQYVILIYVIMFLS